MVDIQIYPRSQVIRLPDQDHPTYLPVTRSPDVPMTRCTDHPISTSPVSASEIRNLKEFGRF